VRTASSLPRAATRSPHLNVEVTRDDQRRGASPALRKLHEPAREGGDCLFVSVFESPELVKPVILQDASSTAAEHMAGKKRLTTRHASPSSGTSRRCRTGTACGSTRRRSCGQSHLAPQAAPSPRSCGASVPPVGRRTVASPGSTPAGGAASRRCRPRAARTCVSIVGRAGQSTHEHARSNTHRPLCPATAQRLTCAGGKEASVRGELTLAPPRSASWATRGTGPCSPRTRSPTAHP
jgi:hypothetical protein